MSINSKIVEDISKTKKQTAYFLIQNNIPKLNLHFTENFLLKVNKKTANLLNV